MVERFGVGDRVRRKPRPNGELPLTLAGTVVALRMRPGSDDIVQVEVEFDTFKTPQKRPTDRRLVDPAALERDLS